MKIADIHILVVDDDQILRELLSETLLAIGYQTTSAINGQEALVELQSGNFDLVITDIKMPVMDGVSLLQNIKRQWPKIPVLFITGISEPEAIGPGFPDGFLTKPFRISHIEALIEDTLLGKTEVVDRSIQNVLIVDDDEIFGNLLSEMIAKANYTPRVVLSGRDAMQSLAEDEIDAVITDIIMPQMNGLTLLSLIKKTNPNMPVILITGNDNVQVSSEGTTLNPDGFLKKPFKMQAIVDLLNKLSANADDPTLS